MPCASATKTSLREHSCSVSDRCLLSAVLSASAVSAALPTASPDAANAMEASGPENFIVGIISKLLTDLVARNDQVQPPSEK